MTVINIRSLNPKSLNPRSLNPRSLNPRTLSSCFTAGELAPFLIHEKTSSQKVVGGSPAPASFPELCVVFLLPVEGMTVLLSCLAHKEVFR